jgi:GntR family transcriptional regulator
MDAPLRKGSPLYVQLAGAFRRLITRNVWPVGSQVASVEDLAHEYGVAGSPCDKPWTFWNGRG